MISRITLRNWKAYESLDLELSTGATFVIARNGIGKTSLIQGMAWGLFGESNIDFAPREAVRSGAEEASVRVELDLPTGESAVISRTVRFSDGKTDVGLTVGSTMSSGQSTVDDMLRDAYEADPSFLARVGILPEGSIARETRQALSFDVYEHLSSVLGVSDLLAVAREMRSIGRAAEKETAGFRAEERAQASERGRWEDELGRVAEDLEEAETQLTTIREEERVAAREYDNARLWVHYDSASAEYRKAVEQIGKRVGDLTGHSLHGTIDVVASLESARQDASVSVEEARDAEAMTRGRSEAISRFIDDLSEAEAVCPVCLRSIDPSEANHAIALHRQDLRRFADDASRQALVRTKAEQRLEQVEGLRQSLNEVHEPRVPDQPRSIPLEEAEGALAAVRNRQDELRDSRSRLRQVRDTIRGKLEQDDELGRRVLEAERAYRTEAIASVAERTLKATADELTQRRLEPLGRELESRWKEFWGGVGGLRILSSGALALTKGDRDIAYDQMSGGEKVIAVLMVRLITVFMTTKSRFLWLDEPLEHLDPRNRRMVASMLVKAAASGQFRQLLVTTYEEPVARRLADQTKNAKVVYVTSDPVV